LFEAMSAVEMMEPRMDVGADPSGVRSLADALASGAAPPEPSAPEAAEILDGLLVRSCAECVAREPRRVLRRRGGRKLRQPAAGLAGLRACGVC
jgi:hypothetical protein